MQAAVLPPRRADITFCAPAWDELRTATHAAELRNIEGYIRSATFMFGLTAVEIEHDLNDRFGHMGTIAVTASEGTRGLAFWIDISEDEETAEA